MEIILDLIKYTILSVVCQAVRIERYAQVINKVMHNVIGRRGKILRIHLTTSDFCCMLLTVTQRTTRGVKGKRK